MKDMAQCLKNLQINCEYIIVLQVLRMEHNESIEEVNLLGRWEGPRRPSQSPKS